MLTRSLLVLATATLSTAHFLLNWPTTAGFDDDEEPTSPCGGQTPLVNSSNPQVSVDRFAISIYSTHPAGTWTIGATKDTASPYTFTTIASINTTGVGEFCLTDFAVPSDFAGAGGVIQVIDDSIDGVLYQCAPVQFVTGSNSTQGPTCTNQTGFSATWVSGLQDSTSGSSDNESSSTSSSASGTAKPAATSASSTGVAAIVTGMAGSIVGGIVLAAGLAL